jgi:hypothetical protein
MTVKIHAAPPVRLAHPSVSHRRAADSRCTVVNPLPGAAVGAEKRQATLSSTLGDQGGANFRSTVSGTHSITGRKGSLQKLN